jgi:hypothetical protein
LLESRIPIYESAADIKGMATGLTHEQMVEEIVRALERGQHDSQNAA